jgi:aspartate ammonia-lyase
MSTVDDRLNPPRAADGAPRAAVRLERDLLGEREIGAEVLYGIHTVRALENFPLTGRPVHPQLVAAYGKVKLACAVTNRGLGAWADDPAKADAIEDACREMAAGLLTNHVVVDRLQGGAGTSLNMNVSEVLANRALQILGESAAGASGWSGALEADGAPTFQPGPYDTHPAPRPGDYVRISPLDDLNLHQSTNDTYPTALRLAAITCLHDLEDQLVALQEAFQELEKRFAHVVKVARTEMQDAVLTTLGREMGAYAEALSRDRWRVYKCEERLRVVNLGGTAIGTGLAAPRQYIFRVVDTLRDITGVGLARAENLVEATQNADVFVEVSGILKACATTLLKISGDLRLLSSGPEAGIGEIRLPRRQAGSSIMPGKVNPVIPEAVSQAAMMVMAHDQAIAAAASAGSLDLNPFLPLIADCLLESIDLLARSCEILRRNCVEGIEADESRCRSHVDSSTAVATALLPALGYEGTCEVVARSRETGRTIRATVLEDGILSAGDLEQLLTPEAVTRLGMPQSLGYRMEH